MIRLSLFFGIAIALPLMSTVWAQTPREQSKTVEIPLDQIWGFTIPGTRDVASIPLPEDRRQYAIEREANIEEIQQSLLAKRPSEPAMPGFILPRITDFQLLRVAAGQLGMDARRGSASRVGSSTSFTPNNELSLIFFARSAGRSLQFNTVERRANKVTVRYQFVPDSASQDAVHFAFIPLGKLEAGEYNVEFAETSAGSAENGAGATSVCKAFSFTVREPTVALPGADERTADDTTKRLVRPDSIYTFRMPAFRDVLDLESERNPYSQNLTDSPFVFGIYRALNRPFKTQPAGPAFIVKGRGQSALLNAHAVLTGKAKGETELKLREPATIVFYSLTSGVYCWLDHVDYSDHEVIINYRFVSHMNAEATSHFALIPLPNCDSGETKVTVRQLSPRTLDGTLLRRSEDAGQIVSKSFVFRLIE